MQATVVIAIGSNRRHHRHGSPERVIDAAVAELEDHGMRVLRRSRTHSTAPVGPSDRRFANAAVLVTTALAPAELLRALKAIEQAFGRRRARRWATRVLDLDIIAYGDAMLPSRLRWHHARGLAVPHRAMHARRFVLAPMNEVAPDWRHPVLRRTVRQLLARSKR